MTRPLKGSARNYYEPQGVHNRTKGFSKYHRGRKAAIDWMLSNLEDQRSGR
jgi:hypothetical protein